MALKHPAVIFGVLFCRLITAQDIVFPHDGERCDAASGEGRCMEFKKCPSVHYIVRNGRKPIHCGFNGHTPLVCCPKLAGLEEGNTSGRMRPTPSSVFPPSLSFTCGKRGLRDLFIAGRRRKRSSEGIPVERAPPTSPPPTSPRPLHSFTRPPLIYVPLAGSVVSFRNSWPWMVLLGRKRGTSQNFFCSGSLLNENYVITAAHCMLDPKPFFARLGEHDYMPQESVVNNFPEDVDVGTIIPHPKYKIGEGYHDIALLKLAKPISFRREVSPICLPWSLLANEDLIGDSVTLTGWGQTEFVGRPSTVLREVNVTVFHPSICVRSYSTLRDYPETFPEGMTPQNIICAGVPEGGKDACQGDSGGPMMHHRKDHQNDYTYYLAGIISKGFGCGKKDFPGLYAPIRDHFTLQWIKTVAFQ